jgi:hypothetical protein
VEKKDSFPWKATALALLPSAFRLVNLLAEPRGGWAQYVKKEEEKVEDEITGRGGSPKHPEGDGRQSGHE